MTKLLFIDVSAANQSVKSMSVAASTELDVVTALEDRGYTGVKIIGLERFHPRYRDGTPANRIILELDPDVDLLWGDCKMVAELSQRHSYSYQTFLMDGTFEISGEVLGAEATVIVGEYRRDRVAPVGVVVKTDDFLRLWQNVCAAITEAICDEEPGMS